MSFSLPSRTSLLKKFVDTIGVGKVPLQPNRGYQSVLMGNFFRH